MIKDLLLVNIIRMTNLRILLKGLNNLEIGKKMLFSSPWYDLIINKVLHWFDTIWVSEKYSQVYRDEATDSVSIFEYLFRINWISYTISRVWDKYLFPTVELKTIEDVERYKKHIENFISIES